MRFIQSWKSDFSAVLFYISSFGTSLRGLNGQQINHHIYQKILDLISLAINYFFFIKKENF